MGIVQSTSSGAMSRIHRSTVKDVKDHLPYCLEELSKWEDGAALMHDLLHTDVSHAPPEQLISVGGGVETAIQRRLQTGTATTTSGGMMQTIDEETIPPSEFEKSMERAAKPTTATTSTAEGGTTTKEGVEKTSGEGTTAYGTIDTIGYRHLLQTVDDVLRSSSASEYFHNIPSSEVERAFTHPSSRFILPPHGIDRSQSSSHYFGVAALQLLLEDQMRSGGVSTTAAAGVGGIGSFIKEGPSSAIGTHESKTPMTGEEKSSSASGRPVISFESLENQRTVVAAKYLFIMHFLHVLTDQAEFNYKAVVRMSNLKKLFKNQKQFDALPPLQRHRVSKLAEENSSRLERGLIGFDRARLALGWLMRNFALSASSFKVNAAILQLKSKEAEWKDRIPSAGLSSSIHQSQLSELNQTLAWLKNRQVKLMIELQANERDSLTVGMYFLDASLSGYLEPPEVPDLSARLFNELDAKKKGRISPDHLQECVHALCTRLDQKEQRVHSLRTELIHLSNLTNDQAVYTREKNSDELNKLQREIIDLEGLLRELYSYFHSQFVRHVFSRVASSTARLSDLSKVASVDHLSKRMEEVVNSGDLSSLEREMLLGRYTSSVMKQTAGTDAGVPGTSTSGGGGRGTDVMRSAKEKLLGVGGGTEQQLQRETEASSKFEPVQRAVPTPYGSEQQSKPIKSTEEEKLMTQAGVSSLPVVSTAGGVPKSSSTIEPSGESRSFTQRMKEGIMGKGEPESSTERITEQKIESEKKVREEEKPVTSAVEKESETRPTTETETTTAGESTTDTGATTTTADDSVIHTIEHGIEKLTETVKSTLGISH